MIVLNQYHNHLYTDTKPTIILSVWYFPKRMRHVQTNSTLTDIIKFDLLDYLFTHLAITRNYTLLEDSTKYVRHGCEF